MTIRRKQSRRTFLGRAGAGLGAVGLAGAARAAAVADGADIVVFNSRIHTVDDRAPQAQAFNTLNGAHAAHEEDIKGSITPGKLADFVVLAEDRSPSRMTGSRISRSCGR